MAGKIPDARFRLSHTFTAQPALRCDPMTDKGLLIGQNAAKETVEAIYLGKTAEAPHQNVWMDTRGAHVLYVMGKRRSGKSYTLGSIAEGLVSETWVHQGEMAPGVLILDTMNVYLTMPFTVEGTLSEDSPELKEARRWRLEAEDIRPRLFSPAGFDLPQQIEGKTITVRASDLGPEEWCGLFEVDPFVDPMGHLLTTVLSKLSEEGIQDKDTDTFEPPKVRFDLSDMIEVIEEVIEKDEEVEGFSGDTRNALIRRFQALGRMSLFGPEGLDVRGLLQPGKISVLLLRDLDAEMRSVLVSLIVKRVMQLRSVAEQYERLVPIHREKAAKLRQLDPHAASEEEEAARQCQERAKDGLPRSWIIVDEAHNYIPATGTVPSKRPLRKYVNEGRNLGLSIVVATQQPSGLDPSIQRNADINLIHSLSHQDDIVAARGMINTSNPDEVTLDAKYKFPPNKTFEALVRNLPVGYAVASTDRANRLFPIRIRPRATVHGGSDY